MGEIKAIETFYNGHRFRSRLEARWAVAFDVLGIGWEYEPEGFETSSGPYLPDFRFDDRSVLHSGGSDGRLWAEVKGDADRISGAEAAKILAFAFAPGEPRWIVSLGPIPDPGAYGFFTGWGIVDGCPRAMSWTLAAGRWEAYGDYWGDPHRDTLPLFRGHFRRKVSDDSGVEGPGGSAVSYAFRVARTARFEYGESGAQRSPYLAGTCYSCGHD